MVVLERIESRHSSNVGFPVLPAAWFENPYGSLGMPRNEVSKPIFTWQLASNLVRMNRTHKPGFDENGWPLYDAAWFWREALPIPLVIIGLLVLIAVFDAIL